MTTEHSSLTQEDISAKIRKTLRKPRALTPLILLMGFIGASLRYLLEWIIPSYSGFPFATLIVNIFGCFVLEIINQYIGRRLHLPAPLVKSLGIGLIGAFTTIAAFSTQCLSFFREGAIALAFVYISVTILGTFLAALAGRVVAQLLALRRVRRLREEHLLHRKTQHKVAEEPFVYSTPLASLVDKSTEDSTQKVVASKSNTLEGEDR